MFWIQVCILLSFMLCSISFGERLSLCPGDGKQIRCSDDEVILIHSAFYGRMDPEISCISSSARTPCSVNVFSRVDKWCSGFRECFLDEGFTMSNIVLMPTDCPRGAKKYLEVDYTCINVALPQFPECSSRSTQKSATVLRSQEGYIASYLTYQTSCGYPKSPWIIEAPLNFEIQIDIIDIGVWNNGPEQHDQYGKIVEQDPTREVIFGRGVNRNRVVYRSTTSRVEIQVAPGYNYNKYRFILHYKVSPLPFIRTLAVSKSSKVEVHTSVWVFFFTMAWLRNELF